MQLKSVIEKARTLTEALPYIRRFSGRYVIVQASDTLLAEGGSTDSLASDIVLLKYVGIHPVVVHGGRAQASKWSDQMVSALNAAGSRAVSLSGRDANLFFVRAAKQKGKSSTGEVETTDVSLVRNLAEQGYIPVVSAHGVTLGGESLDAEPENVAGKLAETLGAAKLIYLVREPGVEADGTLFEFLDLKEAQATTQDRRIKAEMRARLEDAVRALKGGVRNVHILDGRLEHVVLLEIFTDAGVGTMISNERSRL